MKAFPRDIEIQQLKERHIGVESELGIKGDDRQMVSHEFESKLGKNGLLKIIGFDGGGREFTTNPISIKSLLKQVKGRKYFSEYYAELKTITEVIPSGGTHIHISILDSDHENMESNAHALAKAFYAQFQKVAGRKSTWAREPAGFNTVEECKAMLNERKGQGWYYLEEERAYNMKGSILGPTGHKTLEFRGPVGSNDAEELLVWVEFLDKVVKTANRKSIDGVKFADLLTGERTQEYIKKLKGWRKITKKDLEKTVNVMALA